MCAELGRRHSFWPARSIRAYLISVLSNRFVNGVLLYFWLNLCWSLCALCLSCCSLRCCLISSHSASSRLIWSSTPTDCTCLERLCYAEESLFSSFFRLRYTESDLSIGDELGLRLCPSSLRLFFFGVCTLTCFILFLLICFAVRRMWVDAANILFDTLCFRMIIAKFAPPLNWHPTIPCLIIINLTAQTTKNEPQRRTIGLQEQGARCYPRITRRNGFVEEKVDLGDSLIQIHRVIQGKAHRREKPTWTGQ